MGSSKHIPRGPGSQNITQLRPGTLRSEQDVHITREKRKDKHQKELLRARHAPRQMSDPCGDRDQSRTALTNPTTCPHSSTISTGAIALSIKAHQRPARDRLTAAPFINPPSSTRGAPSAAPSMGAGERGDVKQAGISSLKGDSPRTGAGFWGAAIWSR